MNYSSFEKRENKEKRRKKVNACKKLYDCDFIYGLYFIKSYFIAHYLVHLNFDDLETTFQIAPKRCSYQMYFPSG